MWNTFTSIICGSKQNHLDTMNFQGQFPFCNDELRLRLPPRRIRTLLLPPHLPDRYLEGLQPETNHMTSNGRRDQ